MQSKAAALLLSGKAGGDVAFARHTGSLATHAHLSPPCLLHDTSASACLQLGSGSCAELRPCVPVWEWHPASSLLTGFCLSSAPFKKLVHSHHGQVPSMYGVPFGGASPACHLLTLSAPAYSGLDEAGDNGASGLACVPAQEWLTSLPCTRPDKLVERLF